MANALPGHLRGLDLTTRQSSRSTCITSFPDHTNPGSIKALDSLRRGHENTGISRKAQEQDYGDTALNSSGPAATGVDPPGVSPVRLGEGRAQAVLVGRDHDEVDVIGHQSIAPDRHRRRLGGRRDRAQIEPAVAVGKEHRLAPVAALGDVMGRVGDHA